MAGGCSRHNARTDWLLPGIIHSQYPSADKKNRAKRHKLNVRYLLENLKPRPCRIDHAIALVKTASVWNLPVKTLLSDKSG